MPVATTPIDPDDDDDLEVDDGKDAAWSKLRREAAEWRAAKRRRAELVESIIAAGTDPRSGLLSVAIRGRLGTKPSDPPRMAIVSGELSDLKYGRYRVTYFGPDGPQGHNTRPTIHDIAIEIADTLSEPYEAMSDADVMAWTTTEEFEIGSRIVAYIQAENTFRYLAGRAGKSDWAYDVIRAVNDEAGPRPHTVAQIERATKQIVEATRTLPQQNPRRMAGFVANPPWVTGALAAGFTHLEQVLAEAGHSRWMPQLTAVTAKGDRIIAKLAEYGCGVYGCVLPTGDPGVVLKVTTDNTEARFAEIEAPELAAPICVNYPLVADLDRKHDGHPIYLLWREAADHVGGLRQQLGEYAGKLIDDQHEAGQRAYDAIFYKKSKEMIRARVTFWLEMCERIARQHKVPALRPFGAGLIEVYERQRIVFGDIHPGNMGLVTRGGISSWMITDPGHVAVLEDDL